jgi:hypothetical protein
MERCCGQVAMVHADHVNSWWGVELLIPLLKHTKYYYFLCKIHVSIDANTGEVASNWSRIKANYGMVTGSLSVLPEMLLPQLGCTKVKDRVGIAAAFATLVMSLRAGRNSTNIQ